MSTIQQKAKALVSDGTKIVLQWFLSSDTDINGGPWVLRVSDVIPPGVDSLYGVDTEPPYWMSDIEVTVPGSDGEVGVENSDREAAEDALLNTLGLSWEHVEDVTWA